MRALLVGLLGLAACRDAVTLSIASDRPIPRALDAICVGIADVDATGGQFGQRYVLEGELAALPQTLRVEAGEASEAWAWVRADRGGVPVARASVPIDFGDDATLDLATCVRGPGGAPAAAGAPVGPASARLVASQGQGGTIVVAIDAVGATILDARGHALVATPTTLTTGAPVTAAIALDLDGDCDDDVVVAAGGALRIWRRDGAQLVDAG
ncbi:MAG: hypothetical protein NT062_31105, partial [Proteobacteria bacterium]|nr:hypothetical protein [Pseudomonadota bacterium]